MAQGHGHGGFEFIHYGDPNNEFHIKHPTIGTYFVTYVALLILLAITVGLYYVDLSKVIPIPGINLIVAMIVAILKATLVVSNFMNVKGGTKLVYLWAVIGFLWLILLGGTFMDYLSRIYIDQSGWQQVPYK